MIKSVIKSQTEMVLVFKENGKRLPEYQGEYDKVKERILRDAPPDALFWHDDGRKLKDVRKEEW